MNVLNELGDTVLKIKKKDLCFRCSCNNIPFPVYTLDGDEVNISLYKVQKIEIFVQIGTITKNWSWEENVTGANSYEICFPLDLDVKVTIIMILCNKQIS